MAIVEMRRLSLLGMASDRESIVNILQRFGCVQISEPAEALAAYAGKGQGVLEGTREALGRIQWAIGHLGRYDTTKVGFLDSLAMPEVTAAEADAVLAQEASLLDVVEKAEALERKSGEMRGQETRIRAQVEQLLPWKPLDIPVEAIKDSRDTVQLVGTVANKEMPALTQALSALPASLETIGEERDSVLIWAVAHKSARDAVLTALKAAEYQPVQLSGATGTVAQTLTALHEEQSGLQQRRDALEKEMQALGQEVPRLKVLYELYAARAEREAASARFARTSSTFLLEGWVPEPAADRLRQAVLQAAPEAVLSLREPTADEKPPTLLHNNRVVAPFETIVTSYSYPDPRGIDPTLVMAPFFACLFGMMLSDAGYGLVMAVAIPLIIRFMRPKPGMRKLMWVMFFGGIFTVIWGTVFNTWFGANPSFMPMLIDTLNEPIPMLILCLGMGALHLFVGLGVAAYMNIRRGRPLAALFDQGFWFMLIVGLVMLVLPQTSAIGKWMAIVGGVGIVLTAGREKPKVLGKIMGGFGALYNISSWLSDLLSYMRLFGMGLATGVIGMVINMLVGLLMGGNILFSLIGVVILIGGHAFNFAINALGAYVHSCRLQYIEFFSKFYEDGGDPFMPLSTKPRYLTVQEPSVKDA